MLKVLWPLILVAMVLGQDTSNSATNKLEIVPPVIHASPSLNESAKATDNKKETTTTHRYEIVKDFKADVGSEENPINPLELAVEDESSIANFKYYFALLFVSSLSVISIIVYKTLRLRRSRAEVKYGKTSVNDRSEVEPLGRAQWLEESSDENEDEIFDINFLKNKRTQNV